MRPHLAALAARPTRAQAARDGRWETAWRVRAGGQAPSDAAIDRWLAPAGDDLAVELFADAPDGGRWFVGLRLPAHAAAAERRALVRLTLRGAAARRWPTLGDAVAELEGGIGLPPDALFAGPPSHAELGVVDAWRSTGAVELWRQGRPLPDASALLALVPPASPLRQPLRLPPAVEVAWPEPVAHWLGVLAAREAGGRWLLDPSAAADAVRRWASCSGVIEPQRTQRTRRKMNSKS